MKVLQSSKLIVLGVAVVVLGTVGCATKKYVQQSVQPLDANIHQVDQKYGQKTAQNAEQIRAVDQRAETGISDAQNSAEKANQAASQADQHAQAANQLAQKGVDQAGLAQETADNIDNYRPARQETVLFGFNKSALTNQDQQCLDQVVQTVKGMKHYVIQVRGYTDKTGSKAYNLQLSQQRANAVVRYLTLNGDIPLVRIYNLGYGEAASVNPNSTREGRKLNRRVDVTVFVPQLPGEAAQATQSPSASNGPGQ